MNNYSVADIKQALSKVMHPEINYSLVDLGMIEDIVHKEYKADLTLKLPFPGIPIKEVLIQSIHGALADVDETMQVEITIKQMSQEEREKFMRMAKEKWKL